MGLRLRVDALVRNAKTDERRAAIRDAAKRLVDPVGMGKEYQVTAITNFHSSAEAQAPADVWPFVEVKEGKDASGAP
jgi:NADH dehydrogenase [ubiquinone] 1 alpha subcomplex assembly factor 7